MTVKVKVRRFQGRERLSASFLPPGPFLGFSMIMVGMTMTASTTMATKTAIMGVLMKHHTQQFIISINPHPLLIGWLLQDGHGVWKHTWFYIMLLPLGDALDDSVYLPVSRLQTPGSTAANSQRRKQRLRKVTRLAQKPQQ